MSERIDAFFLQNFQKISNYAYYKDGWTHFQLAKLFLHLLWIPITGSYIAIWYVHINFEEHLSWSGLLLFLNTIAVGGILTSHYKGLKPMINRQEFVSNQHANPLEALLRSFRLFVLSSAGFAVVIGGMLLALDPPFPPPFLLSFCLLCTVCTLYFMSCDKTTPEQLNKIYRKEAERVMRSSKQPQYPT